MSDAPDRDEKTEGPTPKRKQDAIEKGDVLQSKELATALVMMAGASWIWLAGGWMVSASAEMLETGLTLPADVAEHFDPWAAILRLGAGVAMPVVALFAMTLLAAVAAPAALGSLGFRWNAIQPKGSRIDPMSGIKRIFGMQGLIELGKSFVKIALMAAVAWWLLAGRMRQLTVLGSQDLPAAIGEIGHVFALAILVLSFGLVGVAGIDVPMQLFQRAGRLRMTKQEVKDEHKQSEGSPELKGHIRRKQMELKSSTRAALKDASVVLVNPTSFAVALRYRPGFDAAPVVLARGRGVMAQAIRDYADEQAVPVLRYPPLTRALYYTSKDGHPIREDLYIAVATVLAFVFNLERAMAEGVRQPDVTLPDEMRFDADGNREQ
ncbi:MAG: flagellar type III secretion system protein FlhB [Sphingomonas fennica]